MGNWLWILSHKNEAIGCQLFLLLIKYFFKLHLIRKKRIVINKIIERAIAPPELPVTDVCKSIANTCEIIIE